MRVSEGDVSYEIITYSFKNNVIGHYAHVIIANPLHENLPRLVVVIHPTCNRLYYHLEISLAMEGNN